MNNKEPNELEKADFGIIGYYNYNGTLVEKTTKGYYVFGVHCSTPDEVDEIIRTACSILSESIVVKDTGSWMCKE